MSISQIPSGWTITRSDERIVVQHVSGSFYAAAKEGDSGIAESILYMLADSLLNATLSPAHIEDGEEVEVVGHLALDEPFNGAEGLEIGEWEFVPERSAVESMLAVSTGEMVPLMTVAQHQRIVAARALKAAPRVEDEREAFETDLIRRWKSAHPKAFDCSEEGQMCLFDMMLARTENGEYENLVPREAWQAWQSRAALSAPPAAGVPDAQSFQAAYLTKRVWELSAELEALKARPSDDDLWDQTLTERDDYHEAADALTSAIAKHFDQDFGEHSSLNDPWANAVEFMKSAPTPHASEQQRAVVMPENCVEPYGWVAVGQFFGDRDQAIKAAEKTACIEVYSRPQLLAALSGSGLRDNLIAPHLAKGEGV